MIRDVLITRALGYAIHQWFVGNSLGKLQLTQRSLIDIIDMGCEQFLSPLKSTDGHKPSVFPLVMCIVNDKLCLYSLYILSVNT